MVLWSGMKSAVNNTTETRGFIELCQMLVYSMVYICSTLSILYTDDLYRTV